MGILVTGQAFGETLMELLAVRQTMTFGALGNRAVFGVAGRTVDFAMAAGGRAPDSIDLRMAGTAGPRPHILFVADLLRHVHRMAFTGASLEILPFVMGLVAHVAGGYEAVGSMAIRTGEVRMLARELAELLRRAGMAGGAGIEQLGSHRHLENGVGIDVALGTVGKDLHVGNRRPRMAAGTLGHARRPVVFDRTVAMETLVALLALEGMSATIVLDVPENTGMALAALGDGERRRFAGIERGLWRNLDRGYRLSRRFLAGGCRRHQRCAEQHSQRCQDDSDRVVQEPAVSLSHHPFPLSLRFSAFGTPRRTPAGYPAPVAFWRNRSTN